LWTGAINNKGYGIFPHDRGRLAHRFSYLFIIGDPGTKHILHSCDNPRCVRPSHLRLGSRSENMRDALLRDRGHGRSKLTPQKVRAIRAMCKPGVNDLAEIAAKFGVTKGAVGHIKYGVTWAWLQ
jgi:HNH endonuclease